MSETTISLVKGENINLTKGHTDLTKLGVGLGWDMNSGNQTLDLDAFCILLGQDGKVFDRGQDGVKSVCFFGQRNLPGVTHSGDNLTGEGDGDDETILVDLGNVPATVDKIVFGANIYGGAGKGQFFSAVQNCHIRAYNAVTNEEFGKYDVSEDGGRNTALILGEVYRKDGEWKFKTIGEYKTSGEIKDLLAAYV